MMKKLAVGILAHVDAGKTTLSEAMLYMGGKLRRMGRVDKGDAFLDTYELEKRRGITIFSKEAVFSWGEMQITLLDTPGHVDFSAEMERTLQVLDYAILVISGSDGVQGHTQTLWHLLKVYGIPVFLFINKMDLAGERRAELLAELKDRLDENVVDFGIAPGEMTGKDKIVGDKIARDKIARDKMDREKIAGDKIAGDGGAKEDGSAFYEAVALCGESALEQYLDTGRVEPGEIQRLILDRSVFPCFFGSALRLDGVERFLDGLEHFSCAPRYEADFGARVFKITRDSQGNRLTHMKITGGSLAVRDLIGGEKVNQLRIYSGDKFEAVREVEAGTVCAAAGLLRTEPGQGIGSAAQSAVLPILEPVMACRIVLPEGTDAAAILPKLALLEEEEPQLHLTWDKEHGEIHVQIMGEIQMEILKSLISDRFGVVVDFGERSIVYKETIRTVVEGVGHFEPLRHYAEVHLLMEPGEAGSGLSFATDCREDDLDRSWQRLILSHLMEREHRGVLTGSAITDLKITLKSGRAHLKHTEGGDFRQAAFRALRQGLMQAESVLLEPIFTFRLQVPEQMIGRAMTDLERMHGSFEAPQLADGCALFCGSVPVACMDDYQQEVAAYTGGRGTLTCSLKGYAPCHNAQEVTEAFGYDADGDLECPSSSVFCAHGAGFVVGWRDVYKYMHLESCLKSVQRGTSTGEKSTGETSTGETDTRETDTREANTGKKREAAEKETIGTDEVDAILERTFYANAGPRREMSRSQRKGLIRRGFGPDGRERRREAVMSEPGVRTFKKKEEGENYLLVDGYNIVFAWEELSELAKINIDSARGRLLDILCSYQGARKGHLIVVFDAYRVQGHATEFLDYHNIHVVFTKEAETADQYIEKFAHDNGKHSNVTVATSDRLEQVIILGQGCQLLSARELKEDVERVHTEILLEAERRQTGGRRSRLIDTVSEDVRCRLSEMAEEEKEESGD